MGAAMPRRERICISAPAGLGKLARLAAEMNAGAARARFSFR
jgi:hypothetical protein